MKIKKLPSNEFWPLFEKLRPKLFKESLSYSAREVRTSHESKAFPTLRAGIKGRIELQLGLFDGRGKLVGWCSSYQTRPFELYMMNSAVFPKHRRKGHYTALVKRTLSEAKKAGFQVITSNHVATNNAVIIAKLKLGFKITGVELSDEFGVLVRLTYFLNSTRKEIMDFRAGAKKPSKKLRKLFKL